MPLHSYNPQPADSGSTDPPPVEPPATPTAADAQVAADIIRAKVARIYDAEPDAAAEAAEAEAEPAAERSPHQQFMHELTHSNKDLATIQTAWHNYYQGLPPAQKHQVWQEFYEGQKAAINWHKAADPQALAEHKQPAAPAALEPAQPRDVRSATDIKAAILHSVTAGGKLRAKHHLQSLLFGLAMGAVVLVIFMFGFFNEVIIAPFIQPARANADTPLIISSNSVAPTATPEVIIPKINVEIPVDYNETTTNESVIENDLNSGVVHYPTTVLPGQNGNAAFFGHSSNNIFNPGKYKFAFVLLHTLVNGDTFYLTYNSKVYVYQVISHTIVPPSDVGVLGPVAGQTATATLITCDPPGTSINRLVVVGKQISPDPSGNTVATTSPTTGAPAATLPGNGPSLWSRVMGTLIGKLAFAVIILAVVAAVLWPWLRRPSLKTA